LHHVPFKPCQLPQTALPWSLFYFVYLERLLFSILCTCKIAWLHRRAQNFYLTTDRILRHSLFYVFLCYERNLVMFVFHRCMLFYAVTVIFIVLVVLLEQAGRAMPWHLLPMMIDPSWKLSWVFLYFIICNLIYGIVGHRCVHESVLVLFVICSLHFNLICRF
jgi:hypothetical protein